MDDARQALALLVNSTDLPLLAFSVPAFFPTQELEGEKKKKKKKEDKQQKRKNKLEAQQVRKNREKADLELLSFSSQSI